MKIPSRYLRIKGLEFVLKMDPKIDDIIVEGIISFKIEKSIFWNLLWKKIPAKVVGIIIVTEVAIAWDIGKL